MRVEYRTEGLPPDRSRIISFGDANGTTFARIAGGFQWPIGPLPGFAVIVSEDIFEDETIKMKHLRILEEYEDKDLEALLLWCEMRCMDMPSPGITLKWYGDNENEGAMKFASDRKQRLREQGRFDILKVSPAPYLESPPIERFAHYYQRFRQYLSKHALHFPEDSSLKAEIHVLKDDPVHGILALGYVVAALANSPYAGRIME